MDVRSALKSQYHATLNTLREAIEKITGRDVERHCRWLSSVLASRIPYALLYAFLPTAETGGVLPLGPDIATTRKT